MKKKTIGKRGKRAEIVIKIKSLYYYFCGIESNWKVLNFLCSLNVNIEQWMKEEEDRVSLKFGT